MTNTLPYPHTRREDCVELLHGTPVADPYRWLEDDRSDETAAWVEAQNALTNRVLEAVPEREAIAKRITALWDYEKFSVPFKKGAGDKVRYFYTRNDGLQNQSALYWLDSLHGEPRLLLDPNILSDDGTVALSTFSVSDDGELLAYALSSAGSDWLEWRVRRVETGEDLPDLVRWSKFCTAAWTPDSQAFYYSRYDAPSGEHAYKGANYNQKLYLHRIGTDQSQDELVYERPDHKEWGFNAGVTEDGRYLIIEVWHGTFQENDVFYQDRSQPGVPVVELLTGFDAAYNFIGNDRSKFYFYTNAGAPMYRVIAIDVENPARDAWTEVLPEASDSLQGASIVGDKLAAAYLHDAHSRVRVFDLSGKPIRDVDLPGLGTVVGFSGKRSSSETFYLYTSFTTPGTIYHYDVDSGQSDVFLQPRLSFDPAQFVTEQVFYTSKDGTRVPMFITGRQGLERNGKNRTYLYGYGGFNIPITPAFSPALIAWMEMGGIYALANIRGGGEYGQKWHDGGKLRSKQNVFDDFISAAEWLISNNYTSTPYLAIHGRSNGGLLTGACLTQRPDLFGAAIVTVGVLDMLRFHKWTIGWAWVSDYGSPDDGDDFRTLMAYSPYHNVRSGTAYPPTLVTTGDHDDRVFPAHSFKFAAALQAAQTGPAPVLIRIDVRAGHGAGKPTGKLIAEWADIFAFLTNQLA